MCAAAERAAQSRREQSCQTLLKVSAGDSFDLLKSDWSIFSRHHESQASLRFIRPSFPPPPSSCTTFANSLPVSQVPSILMFPPPEHICITCTDEVCERLGKLFPVIHMHV